MRRFEVSMTKAILGMSLYLFGIAFAPIYTPHLSELFGRVPVYMATFPIYMLFILGAGFSQNFASLAICRFFAGFFGGPSLVLIEGTYADVWHSKVTGSYYASLSLASYVGAAAGTTLHTYYS
jgi:MFS transporter, DHA1 family, multidrug resistance protein